MTNLIDITTYPVQSVLDILLTDRTLNSQLAVADIGRLQPRVLKSLTAQKERTKKKAEVFTPSWLVNKMNNALDTDWFSRDNVFNVENPDHTWTDTTAKIVFPENKPWTDYVESTRLEITCGEAPFIVSRYDTTNGEIIPVSHRIGLLDRKFRVIAENTNTESEWLDYAVRAVKSVYGYEYQTDNLMIARINILNSFCDYMYDNWHRTATESELKTIAEILSWNFWNMDGLTDCIPQTDIKCKIIDWNTNNVIEFSSIK